MVGSDYGLWGGYSYSSTVVENTFERNRVGIAIEHGQDNTIQDNRFNRDSTDVYLWANKIEPSDWGYPKHRDTRSRNYRIVGNSMIGARVALRISDTHDAEIARNEIRADTVLVAKGDTSAVRIEGTRSNVSVQRDWQIQPLAGAMTVLPSAYADWPRSTIIVDEWGPYDWKSPKLWPVDSSLSTPVRLRVLGPPGNGSWRVLNARGAKVSKQFGLVNDTIVVAPAGGVVEDWSVTLEYRGQATRSATGIERAANQPYVFSYSRFDPKVAWNVKVYAWNDSTHPLNATSAFESLVRGRRGAPVLTATTRRLDYMWYRPRVAGWPQEKAGVSAATTVNLPPGEYTLRSISDDGIRVFVDDQLVIDDWSVHESRVKEAPLAAGRHRIRVEYFQGDGWAELRAEIVPRR